MPSAVVTATTAAVERKYEEADQSQPSSSSELTPSPLPSRRERRTSDDSTSATSKSHARRSNRRCQRKQQAAKERSTAALILNNVAASLLKHALRRKGHKQEDVCDLIDLAIDALRDSVEVLAPDKRLRTAGDCSSSIATPSTKTLARAEARLQALAKEEAEAEAEAEVSRRREGQGRRRRGRGSGGGDDEQQHGDDDCSSFPGDSPFACAGPIRMRSSPRSPSSSNNKWNSPKSVLAVVSYNLGLAHQLLGAALGRKALVNRATQFYKQSESIVLSIADGADEQCNSVPASRRPLPPPGVNMTRLARSIVNNMGVILFEWGEPENGIEYFKGLGSIVIDVPRQQHGEEEDDELDEREKEEEEEGEDSCNTFAINALVARGTVSSAAA